VRGRTRTSVIAALLASSTAAGAVAGLAAGLVWWAVRAPVVTGAVAAALVLAALLADLAWRRWRAPRPLSIGTQVPQAWGRILAPATAATLYGLRLGVGPLTILNTWRWWAGSIVAASLGPGQAATAGAAFGALRTIVVVVVASGAEARMAERMATVRSAEGRARPALVTVAALGAALLLVACSGDGSTSLATSTTEPRAVTTTTSAVAPLPVDEQLATALLSRPPEGFAPVEGPEGEQPLDLAAASAQVGDPTAERALLETRSFERGYQRRWQRGDEVVLARVAQFADAAGAAAYLEDGLITLTGFGAARFEVADVTDAAGFSLVTNRDAGAVVDHGVAFTRGNRFFLVVISGPSAGLTPDDARGLAAAQDEVASAEG
jgi:hypothetical protein